MAASRCKQCACGGGRPHRARRGRLGSDIVIFSVISGCVRAAAIVGALALSAEFGTVQAQRNRPISVSLSPSPVYPGDVTPVEIRGVDGDERITASVLGQDLALHYDEPQRKWRALVGIDLETTPGAYELRVDRGDGRPATTHTLRISPKRFRVRRLRVAPDFVEPPAAAVEQIARDSAALTEAYARVSPRKWSGAFVLPVDGKPTSNFGTRSYYNGQRRSPHAGVDFSGKIGTPVRAANRGEIVIAGPMYFTGNTIVVDYGDRLFSVFAHLSELHVTVGETVEAETVVGLIGATGRVTGPHLHWSVRLNGARVDPVSLVAATQSADGNP